MAKILGGGGMSNVTARFPGSRGGWMNKKTVDLSYSGELFIRALVSRTNTRSMSKSDATELNDLIRIVNGQD